MKRAFEALASRLGSDALHAFYFLSRYENAEDRYKRIAKRAAQLEAEGLLVPGWRELRGRDNHEARFTKLGRDFYRALCIDDLKDAGL